MLGPVNGPLWDLTSATGSELLLWGNNNNTWVAENITDGSDNYAAVCNATMTSPGGIVEVVAGSAPSDMRLFENGVTNPISLVTTGNPQPLQPVDRRFDISDQAGCSVAAFSRCLFSTAD